MFYINKLITTSCTLPIKLRTTQINIRIGLNENLVFAGYHTPSIGVQCRYRKIFLIAVRCGSLGFSWYLEQLYTENMILGLLAAKYNKKPIMLRYVFRSIAFLYKYGIKRVPHAIGTFASEQCVKPNLPRKIFM